MTVSFNLHTSTVKKVLPILKDCLGNEAQVLGLLHLRITQTDCTITSCSGFAGVIAKGLGMLVNTTEETELLVPMKFLAKAIADCKLSYTYFSYNDGIIESDKSNSFAHDKDGYLATNGRWYPIDGIVDLFNNSKEKQPVNTAKFYTETFSQALDIDSKPFFLCGSEECYKNGEPKNLEIKEASPTPISADIATQQAFSVPLLGAMVKRLAKLPKGMVKVSFYHPTKNAHGNDVPQAVLAQMTDIDLMLMPCEVGKR